MNSAHISVSPEQIQNKEDEFDRELDKEQYKELLRKFKEDKLQLQQNVQELQNQLLQIQKQNSEKDEQNQMLERMLVKIKSDMVDQSFDRAESSRMSINSSRTDQSTFFSVFKQNGVQKMAHDPSRKNLDNLSVHVKKLNEEKDQIKRDYKGQLEAVQSRMKSLEQQLDSKTQQYQSLIHEYKTACTETKSLQSKNKILEEQLQSKELKLDNIQKEVLDLMSSREDLKKKIAQFESILQSQQQTLEEALNKNTQLEKQLKDLKSEILQFKVVKMGKLQLNCMLLFRKNLLDQYIVELETASDRYVYLSSEVTDLIPLKDAPDQFQLVFKQGKGKTTTETFKTENLKSVCSSIKKFLQRSNQESKSELYSQNSQTSLFQGIAQIFGK